MGIVADFDFVVFNLDFHELCSVRSHWLHRTGLEVSLSEPQTNDYVVPVALFVRDQELTKGTTTVS